jgi:putative tricarboxylic transport membrane protein
VSDAAGKQGEADPPAARGLPRADFVTGLLLAALGLAVVVESLRMPRFEQLKIEPYTVPGLVPGALGAVLLVLGAALFLRAARAGGWRLGAGRAVGIADPALRRLLLAAALCVGYAAGLIGRLPFWRATFLFIAGFVALFEWPLASTRRERVRRLAFALLFGALISAAVTLVFQKIFLVRLP